MRTMCVAVQATAGTPHAPLQHAAADARELIFKQRKTMQIEDGTTRTHVISAGPWTVAERLLLAQPLTHGVMDATDPALGLRCNYIRQPCTHHAAFCKATEWASLQSDQRSAAVKRMIMKPNRTRSPENI